MIVITSISLLLLSLVILLIKDFKVYLIFAIPIAILSVVNLSDVLSSQPEKQLQLYAQRIEIIEKAEHSTDPDVIKMAEQVRADIAEEQAVEAQSSTKFTSPLYDPSLPPWVKGLVIFYVFLIFSGFVFMLYKLPSMLSNRW